MVAVTTKDHKGYSSYHQGQLGVVAGEDNDNVVKDMVPRWIEENK